MENQTQIPTSDQFRPAVLRVMNDGVERSFQEICTLAADLLSLSQQEREERIPSGQPKYMNRIGWACSSFSFAGLLSRTRRAHYVITDDGLAVDARSLREYSEEDLLEWPAWSAYRSEVTARKQRTVSEGEPAEEQSVDPDNPLESIEESVGKFNASVETQLRKALQESSPEFFENAVVDLLWAMGYGGTHGDKQRVGKSGDGGIDGVIRQDALGLQNVYIQAKRYADTNSVQRPAIQQFYGALASKGADRGVFITTSHFSKGALVEAEQYRDKNVVLIDGFRLTTLMLQYGVGVQKVREFALYEVDEDYFE